MLTLSKSGQRLGAQVKEVDLARQVDDKIVDEIRIALAEYGFLCFPNQNLSDENLVAFTSRFGPLEVNVANTYDTDRPEVMVLSNIVVEGRPIGLADAGQDWHTDMSYSQVPALATALYAIAVPREDGRPLGDTEFADMAAAYETLPHDVKATVEGRHAVRDFAKFWEIMRTRPGSARPPLTIEQRRKKPPVIHPLVLQHPVTGRKCLYCDPGYATQVVGLPKKESDDLLEFLFRHQVRPEFIARHVWTEGDLLIWDNIATIHRATGGYGPDQARRMHRTQVVLDAARYPAFAYTDNNVVRI